MIQREERGRGGEGYREKRGRGRRLRGEERGREIYRR